LIELTCAECGERFEIGDEFAGITEFCPVCGALNDVPDAESESAEPEALSESPADSERRGEPPPQLPIDRDFASLNLQSPGVPGVGENKATVGALVETFEVLDAPPRGISAPLWWTILVCALVFFGGACIYFFSESWEARNLNALNDATVRGDAYLADADYPNAIKQYRIVVDLADDRNIESTYIRQLIDRAHHGLDDAETRLHAPPPPPATPTTQAAPATQPDRQAHLAIKSFQQETETFPSFIRAHPVDFADEKGNWRRRQYTVWDVTYDQPADTLPLKITLHYDCASRITDGHFSRRDALADDNFVHDESPRIVHCQTVFLWLRGRWVIETRNTTGDPDEIPLRDVRKSLDDLYPLEAEAFGAIAARQ
jgi:hypothetical protein